MSETRNMDVTRVEVGGLPLSVVRTSGTASAAVVVIQEAFGVTPYIEEVAARLARAGYLAVAPHLFHRTGDPVVAYDNVDEVRPQMAALTEDGIASDVDGTLGWLAAEGFGPASVGIVGFCMGGSVTQWTAAHRKLGAAVDFYGAGLSVGRFGFPPLIELGARLSTPWLGLFGEDDASIPLDEVERLRHEAERSGVDVEVATYPHAKHGFHCHDRPAVYDARAADDAWARTLAWFAQYLPAA